MLRTIPIIFAVYSVALLQIPALAQQGPVGAFADTAVGDLVGADVLAADGDPIGEVERLVDVRGEVLAIVGVGGFLGFGEHDVAIPLREFVQAEDSLSLSAYTRSDLQAMIAYQGEGDPLPLDMTVAGSRGDSDG
ncbi:PRC-barrel domain-containing protein [Jannaschia aquimarina]|uniref:PRC-barrel domain protein n=1 Tax=Jannaschia aquimarina TaxID=935700 RepID=A0A0D1CKZ5_9RHOB|nr:PRC-barrel domain-containing protein [Jannaschia aquimarina]KIT15457.1 PRC-barrel domain protein [Jannaschia aquimarina]SNT22114.1 PRC-barrel domain-containing protein [Jannaschia aquimarina]